jgi:hypothetical protein
VVSDFLNKLAVSALFNLKLIRLYKLVVSDFLNKLAVSTLFNFTLIRLDKFIVSILDVVVENLKLANCNGVTEALVLTTILSL